MFQVGYDPYGAIGAASRLIGRGKAEEERERRRMAEQELAMQAERLRAQIEQDAFQRAMSKAQFGEGQRRFDAGLQSDALARDDRQSALGAQLASRRESDMANLAGRQFSAGAARALQQDRLGAGLLEQQMEAEQEAERQAAMGRRQQDVAQMQADAQLRNKLLGSVPPDFVAQGLRDGSLRYSDSQRQEMQKIQESTKKRDPRFNQAEWMAFEAQQAEAYRQVRDNPMEVPFDERPIPLPDMFEQETTEIPGLQGRWQRTMRGGVAKWESVEPPKNPEQEMQFKEREFQIKEQQAQAQQEQKNREYDLKLRDQHNEFLVKQLEREWESAFSSLEAEMPDKADFTSEFQGAEGKTTKKLDQKGFDAATSAYRARVAALNNEFRNRRQLLPLAPSNLTAPFDAQPPITPGQAPAAEVAPEEVDTAQLPKFDNPQSLMQSAEWQSASPGEIVEFIDHNGRRVQVPKQ